PPPHVMGEGIGQKGVVKGSRTGDVPARTIAPTPRWIGWLVSTRNTLTPFARLTKSPTRSLPSVTHESRPSWIMPSGSFAPNRPAIWLRLPKRPLVRTRNDAEPVPIDSHIPVAGLQISAVQGLPSSGHAVGVCMHWA